tara:strand:+ start:136 stop:750 length:615 start_codon:yes stop_codon:yes gene_type:complete
VYHDPPSANTTLLASGLAMSHTSRIALVVLAFLAPQFDCLRVSSPSLRPSRSVFRAAAPRLSAPIEDADDLPKNDAGLPSDEDLMASFKNRLDQEGGATQFRLRTDAQRAIEPLKEGAEGLKDKFSNINIPTPGAGRPRSNNDLLDEDQWKTLVVFFGVVILLSVGTAINTNMQVDSFTSDGAPLEFGSRGYEQRVYSPQLGSQ